MVVSVNIPLGRQVLGGDDPEGMAAGLARRPGPDLVDKAHQAGAEQRTESQVVENIECRSGRKASTYKVTANAHLRDHPDQHELHSPTTAPQLSITAVGSLAGSVPPALTTAERSLARCPSDRRRPTTASPHTAAVQASAGRTGR